MKKMKDLNVKFGQHENFKRSQKFSSRGGEGFSDLWTFKRKSQGYMKYLMNSLRKRGIFARLGGG